MKKLSLLMVFCFLVLASAQSQGDNFGEGSSAINVGVGFGNTVYSGYDMGFPSISASYEYGIVEIPMGSSLKGIVGVGGLVGFGGAKKDYGWGKIKANYFIVAARGNYHFIFHEKFDPYAGIILGYYFGNSEVEYNPGYTWWNWEDNSNGFHGGGYVGARWFFTPAIAAFTELGWNVSIFTVGATFKF